MLPEHQLLLLASSNPDFFRVCDDNIVSTVDCCSDGENKVRSVS